MATAASLVAVSCGDPEREQSSASDPSGITVTATATDTDPSASGNTIGDKLDLAQTGGMMSAGDAGPLQGCEKIDFLFVIDNSGSMEDEQQNLINSFPEFIDSIRTATDVNDYNIMVIDTDECRSDFGVGEVNACDEIAEPDCCNSLCATFPGGTCNAMQCACPDTGDICENQLGAGKVVDKMGNACGIDSGQRYMLDNQADLDTTFACVAEVGIQGSGNEQTLEAMELAITPPMTEPGGCNENFVRDDALLVIAIITDEEDDHEDAITGFPGFGSDGEPAQWYDTVLSVKSNNPQNAVVLALVGPQAPDMCPPLNKQLGGIDGAEVANRILQFTGMFPFGFVGPVCAGSYGPFFDEAVSVVSEACDEFVPPG